MDRRSTQAYNPGVSSAYCAAGVVGPHVRGSDASPAVLTPIRFLGQIAIVWVALGIDSTAALAQGRGQPAAADVSVATLDGGRILVMNARSVPTAWRLVEELMIGAVEGDDPYLFFHIPDLSIDDHGNIYVLDSGNKRVGVFDRDGQFLRNLATEGEGPGEKQYWRPDDPQQHVVWHRPDRLWVGDETHQLLLDTFGRELDRHVKSRVIRLDRGPPEPRGSVMAVDSTGAAYLRLSHAYVPDLSIDVGYVLAARATLSDAGVIVPGADTLLIEVVPNTISDPKPVTISRPGFRTNVVLERSHPRDHRIIWDIGPSGALWVAHRAAHRFHEVTLAGDTLRTVELDSPPPPPDFDAPDDAFETRLSALHVSRDGWLWARREPGDADERAASTWDLFDNCGRYRGVVVAPQQLGVLDLGSAGEVHAVIVGELGEPYVVRLRVESHDGATPRAESCEY